jgi:glycosyltransferase involved in cell wall biosynthesis
MNYKVTISMPCYGRQIRTKRAINSIINQTEKSWEALIVGDNCPVIQELIDSGEYNNDYPIESKFVLENLPINYGHCGYAITNMNIKRAVGEYFVFMANDDVILSNHLENYLSEIEGTDYDFVYFDSFTRYDGIRKSKLEINHIGHSELIIRTDFLRKMPEHTKDYGHDWQLIQNMINSGAKFKKATSEQTTYHVMSNPLDKEIWD